MYTLTIRVSDGKGGVATGTATVSVTDVAEAPVYVGPTTASIKEGMPAGTTLATAAATDEDIGDVVTFSLTAGNVRDVFGINATTGRIYVATASELDYESRTAYSLEVTCTDKSGLTTKATLAVTVINVNEAPVITTDTVSIPENAPNGTRAAAPIAVFDPDNGDTSTFNITAGNACRRRSLIWRRAATWWRAARCWTTRTRRARSTTSR